MSLVVVLLTVFALGTPTPASASHFSDCLCWNITSDDWCGSSANQNFFRRDPCHSWLVEAFAWTIPAMLLAVLFLVFPFLLFAARCCCNCCGGREPTEGLCCPTKILVRDPITGEETLKLKTYSNRSIFFTKALFWLMFGFWIYFSVGVYHINDQVHWALHRVVDRTQKEIDSLADNVNNTLQALETVQRNGGGSALLEPSLIAQVTAAQSRLAQLEHDTSLIVSNISRVEDDQAWGRNQLAYRIPSIPLSVLAVVLFFVFCNCHNGFLTFVAGIFSLLSVFVVLFFILHAVVAQGATELCDNYNDTVIPLLLDVATSKGGCGVDSVVASLDASGRMYVAHACGSGGDASVFGGMLDLCNASKGLFVCPLGDAALAALCATNFNWPAAATAVTQVFALAASTGRAGCLDCNISTCAYGGCTDPAAQAAAHRFQHFASSFGDPMAYVLGTAYADYVNCTGLADAIEFRGPIQNALCESFSTDFSNVSILFLELSLLAVVAVVVLVLGAKRFRKMQSTAIPGEELRISNVSDFVNGVLVTSEADRAVFGTPILGPVKSAGAPVDGETAPLLTREQSMQSVAPGKSIQEV
jgi:hypothetical protein